MNATVSLSLWMFLLGLWLAAAFGFGAGFLSAALCGMNKESDHG
ncbi:hypothetical protein NVS89_15580 [Ancylobacter sp. MQZ15Z-1]|uniref:Uncharacterized protein n=1 Tax=Ancylobacter mangrovi TaxID=2972472 RepID=A0A9X2T7W5_9HYPH|nr:hypothetical protein [Ancylobacter mangrovi]MCS0496523.1 hypothetical protein [Ancylobacter mangrovi]